MTKQMSLFGEPVKEEQAPVPAGEGSDTLDVPEDEDYSQEAENPEEEVNENQEQILDFLSDGEWVHFDSIKQYLGDGCEIDDEVLMEELNDLVKMEKIEEKNKAYKIIEKCDECGQQHTKKDEGEPVLEETPDKDKYGWGQLPRDARNSSSTDGYVFWHIQLFQEQSLDSKKSMVSTNSTYQMPKGMLGSSYGSGGVSFDIDDEDSIQEYFDMLMNSKAEDLSKPFSKPIEKTLPKNPTKKEHDEYYSIYNDTNYYRFIPADRYYVIISDKLVERLAKQDFDFKKWYDQFKSLPESKDSKERKDLQKKAIELDIRGSDLERKLSGLVYAKKDIKENPSFSRITTLIDTGLLDKQKLDATIRELGLELFKIRKELGQVNDEIDVKYRFGGSRKGERQYGHILDEAGITKDDGKVLIATF